MEPFRKAALRHNNREHRYQIYVPPGYDAARPWPAVIFLHGRDECGTDGLKQVEVGLGPALRRAPSQWPFVAILPVKADYRIDEDRLYLTGVSQGGNGTWAFAASRPDLFAAIAPICGYGDPSRFVGPLKGMPIWCFHGEADDIVPLEATARIVRALEAAGEAPRFTRYPGVGHISWDKAYQEEPLPEWFLQHTRAGRKR